MANYSAIKAAVNAYIKANGKKEITGHILNSVLNATIDSLGRYFQFAGGAMPTDDPGTPDQNLTYLAGTAGTYTNFGGLTLDTQEIALLMWDGEWKKQTLLFGIQEVDASVDNQVGTPSVDVDFVNNVLTLSFHNIKGDKGDTGDPAGFGQVTASVDDTIGNPSVQVQTSGEDTAKNIAFEFHGLRGETGITSVVVSVDNTTGNPACSVSLVGQVLHLDFSGLKGLKGDTGVSADYPITIYNGLDSDATDQALAAAQGVVLDGKISQLRQEVADLDEELFGSHESETYFNAVPVKTYNTLDQIIPSGTVYKVHFPEDRMLWEYYEGGGYGTIRARVQGDSDVKIVAGGNVNRIYVENREGNVTETMLVRSEDADVPGVIETLQQDVERLTNDVTEEMTVPSNYEENKYIGTSGSTTPYTVIEGTAEGYIVSGKIPVQVGTVRWYSGFPAKDTTKQLLVFDSSGNCVNYWNAYPNINQYENISITNGQTYIKATFYVGGDADVRIEDENGNVLWRPVAPTKEYTLREEKVVDENGVGIDSKIATISEKYKRIGLRPLFIGETGNLAPNTAQNEYSLLYATMTSSVMMPHRGAKFHFVLPNGILAGVVTAPDAVTTSMTRTDGIENGDTLQVPYSALLYRLFFYNEDLSTIDPDDVNTLLESGEIAVYFDAFGSNIVSDNSDIERTAKALMYNVNVGRDVIENNFVPNIPVFAHISDVHGDAERVRRCFEYCDFIGVTACLVSGDVVCFNKNNGSSFIEYLEDKMATPMLMCVGNHDSYATSTEQELYNFLKHSMDKNNVIVPDSQSVPYPTYFYKDFTAEKIRLISLNQWLPGGTVYYNQAQADFFVDALANTPADYGVIVMSHSPEGKPSQITGKDKFFQSVFPGGLGYATFNGELFIKDIIDAFIAKSVFTKTYTKDGYDSVTVNADFTNIASGVQFLMQVTGHEHADMVGLVAGTTQGQIMMNITCGASLYGLGETQAEYADDSDLPRGGKGSVQDAFNLYAIDRENGKINIIRIGSNMNNELQPRDFMTLSLSQS